MAYPKHPAKYKGLCCQCDTLNLEPQDSRNKTRRELHRSPWVNLKSKNAKPEILESYKLRTVHLKHYKFQSILRLAQLLPSLEGPSTTGSFRHESGALRDSRVMAVSINWGGPQYGPLNTIFLSLGTPQNFPCVAHPQP